MIPFRQGLAADSVRGALADSLAATMRADWARFFDWRALLPGALRVVLILALAFVGYRIIKLVIARIVAREIQEEDPLTRRLREQRAQTLGSLLTSVSLVAIVVISTITILSIFVDTRPLLASVGVLGLAISFGAQSLVKDVITGAFLLAEGQFAIGDVVRLGEVSGMVEKITLRTTVLRDLEGVVHIVPNGEITRVSNLTKKWSRAVLDIGVAYKEDVDRVIGVLRELGEELHRDAHFGSLLIEVPEVLGLQAFADSAVVIRVSAKTLPQKQWEVGREFRRRIKNRFDAEGIEIPFPHTTFYWGEGQLPPALGRPAAEPGTGRPVTSDRKH